MLLPLIALLLASGDTLRIRPTVPPVIAPASAPADSVASVDWYDRAPELDARLAPTFDARLVPGFEPPAAASDTVRKRRKAIEYSDWYYRRLQIHRWGSWVELPLFAGEYWLGNKLMPRGEPIANWLRPAHRTVAGGLGVLFGINTITGVWNLWDSRNDTDDRGLVWTHSALMLASDAGFAITGALGHNARRSINGANQHRNAALASIGLATVGTAIMWVKRGL